MAELEIEALILRFGGLTVLEGVSLAVEPAELFALIGPNGAGKTSVFNCISGIYRGEGRIRFRGHDIAGLAPHEIAPLGIARTFQHGELFPHMSVLDNLLIGRHARIPTNPLPRAAVSAGASGARSAPPRGRGAHHRVRRARARTAMPMPARCPSACRRSSGLPAPWRWSRRLLLLDEPSAGLNRDEREDLARFILRIKHELHLPMIWIEHDMQMVADLADRIHVLELWPHAGRGPPAGGAPDPGVIAAYLGVRSAI